MIGYLYQLTQTDSFIVTNTTNYSCLKKMQSTLQQLLHSTTFSDNSFFSIVFLSILNENTVKYVVCNLCRQKLLEYYQPGSVWSADSKYVRLRSSDADKVARGAVCSGRLAGAALLSHILQAANDAMQRI